MPQSYVEPVDGVEQDDEYTPVGEDTEPQATDGPRRPSADGPRRPSAQFTAQMMVRYPSSSMLNPLALPLIVPAG